MGDAFTVIIIACMFSAPVVDHIVSEIEQESFRIYVVRIGVIVSRAWVTSAIMGVEIVQKTVFRASGPANQRAETVIIRLLEGEFPEYTDIIKKESGFDVGINRADFTRMLKRMSILSSENYKGAVFDFNNGRITVSATNPEIGESKEDMAIEFSRDPIKVAFNPKYFIEILNAVETDKVIINIVNEEKPCVIEGENDKTYLGVIMPMRI